MRYLLTLFFICTIFQSLNAQEKDAVRYLEHIRKARGAYQSQDYTTSMENYEKLLHMAPHDPDVYYDMAKIHASQGDSQQAMDCLTKALNLGLDFGEALDDALIGLRENSDFYKI